MLDTIWRVSEKDFDVMEFCERYQIQHVEKIFIQGEADRRGKINDESGFNVLVSESISSKDNVAEIESFIRTNADALKHLKLSGVSSVFDMGCTVNDQWRVCFVWRTGDAYEVEIVDYH